LYSGQQLKVMIVGGPNQRDDFHVEAGEEFFYQLTGSMDLDVMQGGKRTRMPIKEGQAFVLPKDVPHSPQRYADTIGLVIERARAKHELDELRWYLHPNTNRILYAEKFHCTDLGTQVKAVIDRFMASDLSKRLLEGGGETGKEEAAGAALEPPIHTPLPTSLAAAVEAAAGAGRHTLVDSEFQAVVYKGPKQKDKAGPPWPLIKVEGQELFLLQLSGSSEVACAAGNTLVALSSGQSCLLSGSSGAHAVRQNGPSDALLAVHTTARLL
jgi:3-hydroxyanthranilate 3,4-dioxygenase